MLFYITVLVNLSLLGVEPSHGWMQDVTAYDSKVACEAEIQERAPLMAMSLMRWSGGMGQIDTVECITEKEWIKRNVELGHEPTEDFKGKEHNS